ncbi:winged helix-turn-helix domain-containing protein [Edaphovirga cremea]|uniref:winged helix-turn-helix domain-containing protein n=1 Tax=Edaphovirga cremea TaxID=2267246 RepID=UPI000DEFA1C8|nr:helix-turn-helix domain-containing protein [Edaphovirga cremea]
MNNLEEFGFLIGDDVCVNVKQRTIVRISLDSSVKNYTFSAAMLTDTSMNLLVYLLKNANDNLVTKEELLQNIWDAHNLRSSNQRLWQVIKELKAKLAVIAVPDEFLNTSRGQGYIIPRQQIRTLYFG